jgi:equilibrative nucleoside transporter 1/2/3
VFYLWNNPGFKPKPQDLSPLMSTRGGPRLSPKAQPLMRQETLNSVGKNLIETLQTTQGLLYSITFVFLVTLFLFPGTVGDTYFVWINNMHLANQEGWYQLFIVFQFNVCDTIGRYCGGMPKLDQKIRTINISSILRLLFIATFLLTDFEAPPQWIWNTDWFKIVNLFFFGFTNGYISTLCAVKAPGTVKETRRAIVGAYIGLFICLGVLIGAFLQIGMGPVLALTPKQKHPQP